ncbi:MAG: YafY family transcriptional regulator [Clostridia bacterium]|nr:YafY family transcriptional regulator [Clostridia bacterium]
MKYEIMLKIVFLLLSRKKVTAQYLAARFDISMRTVMRYLDAISLAGIPLISDQGRNGGFYIAESFKLPASFLTETEFNEIIGALSTLNDDLDNDYIHSAIDKLCAVKRTDSERIDLAAGHLIIDGTTWNGNDNVKNTLSLIDKAIDRSLTVMIDYVDKFGEETKREIEPYRIILKQGLWYVYAYCKLREGFRIFKVARMASAMTTENGFTPRELSFDIDDLTSWKNALESEYVDLEVDKTAKTDVEEWLGVGAVYKKNNDKLYVSAKLPYDDWLISKVLSFGGKVKVISPEKLKDDILQKAKEVIGMY